MTEDAVVETTLGIYRHVGAGSVGLTRTTAEGVLPLRPDLRTATGPLASALAVFLQDMAGCNVYPLAPLVAPIQVDVHVRDDARGVDELVGTSEIIREGRSTMVTQARVHAAGDPQRLCAFGQITFATLGSNRDEPDPPHRTMVRVPSDPPPHLLDWLGARPRPEGDGLELGELAEELIETVTLGGTPGHPLHGGPIQILIESTAWHVVSQRIARERLQVQDQSTAMLTATRRPPFVCTGEVLTETDGAIDCRVELREDGGVGRVTAVSYAHFAVTEEDR